GDELEGLGFDGRRLSEKDVMCPERQPDDRECQTDGDEVDPGQVSGSIWAEPLGHHARIDAGAEGNEAGRRRQDSAYVERKKDIQRGAQQIVRIVVERVGEDPDQEQQSSKRTTRGELEAEYEQWHGDDECYPVITKPCRLNPRRIPIVIAQQEAQFRLRDHDGAQQRGQPRQRRLNDSVTVRMNGTGTPFKTSG